MPNSNNRGADQPAHPRSLISTFVVRCLDSIIPLVSLSENFKPLPRFCDCADWFESTLVANPKDRFSRDEAQMSAEFLLTPNIIWSILLHLFVSDSTF